MTTTRRYTDESLLRIQREIAAAVPGCDPGQVVSIEVVDPDVSDAHYAGEFVEVGGQPCRYRGLSVWVELAQVLGCTLGTPHRLDDGFIRLSFRVRDLEVSWHQRSAPSGDVEKYGAHTDFGRIDKFEDPSFVDSYLDSLRFLSVPEDARVLSLGVNTGAELGIFSELYNDERLSKMELIGVDHSASAIAEARRRYPHPAFRFEVADLSTPNALDLGRFDLVIAINTLHSPALDGQAIFRRVIAENLTPRGGVLLGFPNARYVDHALIYGAKVKNYRRPELSVLLKEATYYKRYLHQHKFQVTVTGKHTLLLTARPLGGER